MVSLFLELYNFKYNDLKIDTRKKKHMHVKDIPRKMFIAPTIISTDPTIESALI